MVHFSRPLDRPTPIDMKGARSGYVYVAQSPDRPEICKVGHTMRPPHIRMGELGKTTWLSPMRVNGARFFWDAITVEHQIHQMLGQWACAGTEEWFNVPARQVASLLPRWAEPQRGRRMPASAQLWEDPQWLQQRMEWALDQVSSARARDKKDGWRDIERLSALGHAPASWLLAERLTAEGADPEQLLWVLDAANRQGHPGASLRRDWIASLTSEDPTRRAWKRRATEFLENKPDPADWQEQDRDTLAHEVELWRKRPSMSWRDDLPDLLSQV